MKKWIKISATLLPMMFIGCTEHSLDSHGLFNEEVHIQFAARPEINYEIDVVTRAKDNEYSMGLVGVAVTEKDSAADCLAGLNVYDFCRTLVNTEFTGVLDGCIYPVDGVQRTFPFEKGSAMAVYAYLPYRNTTVAIVVTFTQVKSNSATTTAYYPVPARQTCQLITKSRTTTTTKCLIYYVVVK